MRSVAGLAFALVLAGCASAPSAPPDATLAGREYAVICGTASAADCATRVDDLVASMATRFPNRPISMVELGIGGGWSVLFRDGEGISANP